MPPLGKHAHALPKHARHNPAAVQQTSAATAIHHVRAAVAANPNTSIDLLGTLTRDGRSDVRQNAARGLLRRNRARRDARKSAI